MQAGQIGDSLEPGRKGCYFLVQSCPGSSAAGSLRHSHPASRISPAAEDRTPDAAGRTPMLTVFGKQVEEGVHRGPRWKYPHLQPNQHITFARAIKLRDDHGRLLGILEEVTWGDQDQAWRRLDPDGTGRHISTFCVERDNLTSRMHNSRLVRKTLRFSKERPMLEAAVALEDAYYNFCLPHHSLKQPMHPPQPTKGNGSPKKWWPHTPMMAEGITDHVWTLEELLSFRIPPTHLWIDP